MNGLHPCTLPQRAPFAAVRRVSPLCAVFCPDCECVRRSAAKPHVAPTCGQREKAQAQSAEKPRRGGKNPPVREEPASHLASRRCPGVLPNAKYRAEACAHFYERRKDEKRQTIQHSNLSTRLRDNPPKSGSGAHEPERYVISCCLGKKIIILDGLKEVLRQQKAIGNNLNQLAVLANMGKVQFANLDSAVQEFSKINTALRELQEGGAGKSQSSIS